MTSLTQLKHIVSIFHVSLALLFLVGYSSAAYILDEKLENLLSYAVSDSQVYINIPTSLAPWKSIDVIQYNNRLNLHWDADNGSTFMECTDNNCKAAAASQDLGDETDAAAGFDINPSSGVSSLKYISPKLVASTDGDYSVSFVVIVQYDDDTRNQYAQINTSFQ